MHALAASIPKNRPLFSSDALRACFEHSKEVLADYTLLAFPDPTASTELVADASGQFIGAVLKKREKR